MFSHMILWISHVTLWVHSLFPDNLFIWPDFLHSIMTAFSFLSTHRCLLASHLMRSTGLPCTPQPMQSCPSSLASSLCVCAQAHLTLCDPMDWSPPDSSVREIFLARILEWVAMPSFRGSSWSRDQTHLSCISCTGRWAAQGTSGKEPACQRRRRKRCRFHPWVGKISLRSARQPTPIFLSGESHGQRSLADYSPGVAKSQKWLKQLSTRIQKNHWLLNRSPIRISKAKLKT